VSNKILTAACLTALTALMSIKLLILIVLIPVFAVLVVVLMVGVSYAITNNAREYEHRLRNEAESG